MVEKRMAENGGYDLSDPFIDDGELANQRTALSIPEPPPFQVIRYNPEEAMDVEETAAPEPNPDSTRRSFFQKRESRVEKGDRVPLTPKQKAMLANWNPSDRTKEILAELRVAFVLSLHAIQVRAGALFADKDCINTMPNDFDDLLFEVGSSPPIDSRSTKKPLPARRSVPRRWCFR